MTLEALLPIIINSLIIILLIVVIILVIKCIYVIDATKRVLDNVESKVNSLNGLFSIIDFFLWSEYFDHLCIRSSRCP